MVEINENLLLLSIFGPLLLGLGLGFCAGVFGAEEVKHNTAIKETVVVAWLVAVLASSIMSVVTLIVGFVEGVS